MALPGCRTTFDETIMKAWRWLVNQSGGLISKFRDADRSPNLLQRNDLASDFCRSGYA
jgi:hypothetical protein